MFVEIDVKSAATMEIPDYFPQRVGDVIAGGRSDRRLIEKTRYRNLDEILRAELRRRNCRDSLIESINTYPTNTNKLITLYLRIRRLLDIYILGENTEISNFVTLPFLQSPEFQRAVLRARDPDDLLEKTPEMLCGIDYFGATTERGKLCALRTREIVDFEMYVAQRLNIAQNIILEDAIAQVAFEAGCITEIEVLKRKLSPEVNAEIALTAKQMFNEKVGF